MLQHNYLATTYIVIALLATSLTLRYPTARGDDNAPATAPLSDQWRNANIEQLANLIAQKLENERAEGVEEFDSQDSRLFWHTVAELAWGKFLSDDSHFVEYPPSALWAVTHILAPYLEPSQKSSLLSSLDHRFAQNPDTLRSLQPKDFYNLCQSLRRLNISDPLWTKIAIQWLNQNPTQLDNCDPRELSLLLSALNSDSETSEAARSIVQIAWSKYLSDTSFLASPKNDALLLCCRTAAYLSPNQRDQIRQSLTFADLYSPQIVAALNGDDVNSLCTILKICDFTDFEISNFIVRWRQVSDNWKTADPYVLAQLVNQLKNGAAVGASITTMDFCNELYAQYLTERLFLSEVDTFDLTWIVRSAGISFTVEQKESLAKELYKSILVEHRRGPAPSLLEISSVGKLLEHANLDNEGTFYSEYAQATAAALHRGDYLGAHLYWDPKFVSMGLCSKRARDIVQSELMDSSGNIRLNVLRVLAFAFQRANRVHPWEDYLDKSISGSEGDERAAWLIGRAYIAEIEKANWGSLNGEGWLQQAIEVAATDKMRANCAIWLSQRFCYQFRYQSALFSLRQVLSKMSDDTAEKMVNDEIVHVEQLQQAPGTSRGRRNKRWEAQHLSMRAAELEGWIASQKAVGQTEGQLRLAQSEYDAIKIKLAHLNG